jgi:TonB family protein
MTSKELGYHVWAVIVMGTVFAQPGLPADGPDGIAQSKSSSGSQKFDNAGLPAGRYSWLEVLSVSALTTEQRTKISEILNRRKIDQAPILAKLGHLWLNEMQDYPELVMHGNDPDAHPLPPGLDSHDQQVEKLRTTAYQSLSGYVSPSGGQASKAGAPKQSIGDYASQEKPLILELNDVLDKAWQSIKNVLSEQQQKELQANRQNIEKETAANALQTTQQQASNRLPQQNPANVSSVPSATGPKPRRAVFLGDKNAHKWRVESKLIAPSDMYVEFYINGMNSTLGSLWQYERTQMKVKSQADDRIEIVVDSTINSKGKLADWVIKKSSGNAQMDESVIKAYERTNYLSMGIMQHPPILPDATKIESRFTYPASAKNTGKIAIVVVSPNGKDLGPYLEDLKHRISSVWFQPFPSNDCRDVILSMKILKDGQITSPSVAVSSGELDFDKSAYEAIAKVRSLSAMPTDSPEHQGVQITFHYNLLTGDKKLLLWPLGATAPELDRSLIEWKKQLSAAWRIPANAGQKPRRVIYRAMVNGGACSPGNEFSCGCANADQACSWAIFNAIPELPDGVDSPLDLRITFDYDKPGVK